MVNEMGRGWRSKLSDAFSAYRMAFKTLISTTPYQLVHERTCHLPVELEYKAFYVIKKWNMDLEADGKKQKNQNCQA
jgi:hypothetical protein